MNSGRRASQSRRCVSLFWKLYLYGFGLLIVIAITAGLATHLGRNIGETPDFHNYDMVLSRFLSPHFPADGSTPDGLQRLVEELSSITRISFLIMDANRNPIAKSGLLQQAVPAEKYFPKERKHRFFLKNQMANLVIPIYTGSQLNGYALLSWQGAGHARFIVVAFAVLTMLTLMPYLFARAISRPLKKISDTARAIGEGRLSTRTEITRTDEIGLLAREVDRMAARIEHLIASEKTLMANISHEIRTPLARIRVLLEILDEAPDGQGMSKEHLCGLSGDVAELERLLEDVFLTARLDLALEKKTESSLILHLRKIRISELIKEMTPKLQEYMEQRILRMETPSDLPELMADPDLIRRVIQNLIDNAVKYSNADDAIEMQARHQEGKIYIEVRDRGVGVFEDDLERIFEPFFRASNPLSEQKGVGIGLALCKRIVEAHGGGIHAENREGGGMKVEFWLPI